MNRFVASAFLSLAACAGGSRAAAPPVAPAVRSLSLAEAARLALEGGGYRVERDAGGSLRVSHATRSDSLEALRLANQGLLNVEVAYWNLYQARKALSARERAVRDARELLRICDGRREAGTASVADVTRVRTHYRSLRERRGEAAALASEYERQLAALTGLGAGTRLRPSDRPSLHRARPDWEASLRDAVSRRPELLMSREDVSSSSPELQARSLEVLEDQEGKAQHLLELYYRRLDLSHKQIRTTRAQREAFGEMLLARKVQYATGRCSLAALLEAQRSCAEAQAREYAAIGTYNNALAGFEYGKGASLDRHHMVFGRR